MLNPVGLTAADLVDRKMAGVELAVYVCALFFDVMLPISNKTVTFLPVVSLLGMYLGKEHTDRVLGLDVSGCLGLLRPIPFLDSSCLPSSNQGHTCQGSEGLASVVLV